MNKYEKYQIQRKKLKEQYQLNVKKTNYTKHLKGLPIASKLDNTILPVELWELEKGDGKSNYKLIAYK